MLGIQQELDNCSESRGNYYNTYSLDVPFESALTALAGELNIDSHADELRQLTEINDICQVGDHGTGYPNSSVVSLNRSTSPQGYVDQWISSRPGTSASHALASVSVTLVDQ